MSQSTESTTEGMDALAHMEEEQEDQEQGDSVPPLQASAAAAAVAAAPSPARAALAAPTSTSAPQTPVRSGSNSSLVSSARKRRIDRSEEDEAEGAILGSDSKRRRGGSDSAYFASPLQAQAMKVARANSASMPVFRGSAQSPVSPAHAFISPSASGHPPQFWPALLSSSPQPPLANAVQPLARSMSVQSSRTPMQSIAELQRRVSTGGVSAALNGSNGGGGGGVSSVLAAAIAAASCKLCVSNLTPELLDAERLTAWCQRFGEVASLTLLPPDRCIVQFTRHEAALAAFCCDQPLLGEPAVRLKWVVPKRDGAARSPSPALIASAAASAASASAVPQPATTEEILISSRSGKEITLVRKVRPSVLASDAAAPPAPAASLAHPPSPSIISSAGSSAFLAANGKSVSMPALHRPAASAAGVLQSPKGSGNVATSANGFASIAAAVSSAPSYANMPQPALLSLLQQSQGMLTRLAALGEAADSDSMRRSLRAKVAAIQAELNRRGAAPSSAPLSVAVPPAIPRTINGFAGMGVAVAASPTRSPLPRLHSPSSASASSQVDLLRSAREREQRIQQAHHRAAHSKQLLDDELDSLRKEAQLATIVETDT